MNYTLSNVISMGGGMRQSPKPKKTISLQLDDENVKINHLINRLRLSQSVHLQQAKDLHDSMLAVTDSIIRDRHKHARDFEELDAHYGDEAVAAAGASIAELMRRRDQQILECIEYANSVLTYMVKLEKKNKHAYRAELLSTTHGYQILNSLIDLNNYAAKVIDEPDTYNRSSHASLLENASRIIKSATHAAIGHDIPFGKFKRYQDLFFTTCDRIAESTALKYLVAAVLIAIPPLFIAVMVFTAICILADMPQFLKHDRLLADSYILSKRSPVGRGINLSIFQAQYNPVDAFEAVNAVKSENDKSTTKKK